MAQGQEPQQQALIQPEQQPSTSTSKPGTILVTTFPNGSSIVLFVNGAIVQPVDGIGYLVRDSSASLTTTPPPGPCSSTIVNSMYQAIPITLGITLPPPTNDTNGNTTIPLPQQPNTTEPTGPDRQCLFDPSLPHCASVEGDCPEGFYMNEDEQCFPQGGCPDGYYSVEDDRPGTCYPDSEPCPDDQVMSEVGNYCLVLPSDEMLEGIVCPPGSELTEEGNCMSGLACAAVVGVDCPEDEKVEVSPVSNDNNEENDLDEGSEDEGSGQDQENGNGGNDDNNSYNNEESNDGNN